MIEVDPVALGFEFAGGVALGAVVGFGTKRIARVLAVVIGVQLVVFRYLESQGILFIDWERLTRGLLTAGSRDVDVHWLESMLSTVTIGVGFVSGFLIGYHRG